MQKMIVRDIVVDWLKLKLGREFTSRDVETKFPAYAELFYGVACNPGTAGRKFREVRQDTMLLSRHSIRVINVSTRYPNRKENTWIVGTASMSN